MRKATPFSSRIRYRRAPTKVETSKEAKPEQWNKTKKTEHGGGKVTDTPTHKSENKREAKEAREDSSSAVEKAYKQLSTDFRGEKTFKALGHAVQTLNFTNFVEDGLKSKSQEGRVPRKIRRARVKWHESAHPKGTTLF